MNDFIPIQNFSKYMINRDGVIINKKKQQLATFIVSGYYMLMLYDDKKNPHRVSVHRLIGLNFIPNPENKPVIDHIDRNKLNNTLSNLRWATVQENRLNSDDITTPDQKKEYKRNWTANYRKNMDEDKHQDILEKRRETFDNSKQQEYTQRPEVKERRLADQQRKRNTVKLFTTLAFH